MTVRHSQNAGDGVSAGVNHFMPGAFELLGNPNWRDGAEQSLLGFQPLAYPANPSVLGAPDPRPDSHRRTGIRQR